MSVTMQLLMPLIMTSAGDDDDCVYAYGGDDVTLHCFARVRAAIWHFGKIMLPCG